MAALIWTVLPCVSTRIFFEYSCRSVRCFCPDRTTAASCSATCGDAVSSTTSTRKSLLNVIPMEKEWTEDMKSGPEVVFLVAPDAADNSAGFPIIQKSYRDAHACALCASALGRAVEASRRVAAASEELSPTSKAV